MVWQKMNKVMVLMVMIGVTTGWAGELLVDHVPTAILTATNLRPAMVVTSDVAVRPVSIDRWEKFEAEFGVQQPSRSLVKNSLQTAKYQLDRTALALQEFVDTVSDRLRFDYGLSDLGLAPRTYVPTGNFLTDTLNQARLKSDIDVKLGAKAFVGVKLTLPLGN